MTRNLVALMGDDLEAELARHLPERHRHPLGVCLLVDADRTLGPDDTGRIVGRALAVDEKIRQIFESGDYTDEAFSAVSQVWSEIEVDLYNQALERVAAEVPIRAAWLQILEIVSHRAPVIAVTAGIPQVWRTALANHGMTHVPVIGGCHIGLDAYLISARSKADLVRALQARGWRVVAAGDSRVDLPMLRAADVAMFVPDHKGSPGLRAELDTLPHVRHLIVDEQRFEGLRVCSALEAASMILRGGSWHAD